MTLTTEQSLRMNELRKRIKHKCAICGNEFVATTNARYCSNRCRQLNKRLKTRNNP